MCWKVLHHKRFCKKKKVDSFNTNGIKTINLIWSEWQDSNLRHPAPKAGALPSALHPVIWSLSGWAYSPKAATWSPLPLPGFFAALRLLLRRGQPYQYNGLQGESQPAPAAAPPCEKQNPPPAAMECLAALCFTLFLYNFFMKKPNGFYKYNTEQ